MKTIGKAKYLFIVTLLVSLFAVVLTLQSGLTKVNASDISGSNVGDADNTLRVVVEKSDGSGEETLFYLKEMIGLYGVNGKIIVVPESYDNEGCTELGNVGELTQEFGASGKIVLKGKNVYTELGTISSIGGCETNKKVVIVEDDDDDPDVVGICTIGQLVSMS